MKPLFHYVFGGAEGTVGKCCDADKNLPLVGIGYANSLHSVINGGNFGGRRFLSIHSCDFGITVVDSVKRHEHVVGVRRRDTQFGRMGAL